MPIPSDLVAPLSTVVGRTDFACLQYDPDRREWTVGLVGEGRHLDGSPKMRWVFGARLTQALQRALAEPVMRLPPRAKGAA